jgi:hypothetical protein
MFKKDGLLAAPVHQVGLGKPDHNGDETTETIETIETMTPRVVNGAY